MKSDLIIPDFSIFNLFSLLYYWYNWTSYILYVFVSFLMLIYFFMLLHAFFLLLHAFLVTLCWTSLVYYFSLLQYLSLILATATVTISMWTPTMPTPVWTASTLLSPMVHAHLLPGASGDVTEAGIIEHSLENKEEAPVDECFFEFLWCVCFVLFL